MLDELLEIFDRDRDRSGARERTGFRARLARLFGGDDESGDEHRREKRHHDRRERGDRFDWGDD